MSTFIIFAFLAALSLGAMSFIVGRKIMTLRFLSPEERRNKMSVLPLFFDFVHRDVILPSEAFVASVIQPALLKIGEKFLRRFRLLILKTEAFLQRLSNYFRGKRIAIKNSNGNGNGNANGNGKNGHFWNELQKTKDEFHASKKEHEASLPVPDKYNPQDNK